MLTPKERDAIEDAHDTMMLVSWSLRCPTGRVDGCFDVAEGETPKTCAKCDLRADAKKLWDILEPA